MLLADAVSRSPGTPDGMPRIHRSANVSSRRAVLTQAAQQSRDFKLGYMPARLTDSQQADAQAHIGADGDGLGLLPV